MDRSADRVETRARLASPGEWGTCGNANEHQRYTVRITGRGGRRKCDCGCGRRATHTGAANGLGLTSGCELSIRRWARDGCPPTRQRQSR